MSMQRKVHQGEIRLIKGDITDLEVEAFVLYARSDLKLWAGYGNAIATRGGPEIRQELEAIGGAETGTAVLTGGGNLKAKYVIHAVGPKFQEPDLKAKLHRTMLACLNLAAEKGLRQVAFPAMGAGFYGIPLPLCADTMISAMVEFLQQRTSVPEIIICALDNREYAPFQSRLESLEDTWTDAVKGKAS
ncbi:MAG: O-acetyl-ADP-ribose deacetylase [Candidatus Zixiibacteriota bacterium]|nr:MAG: O-acetyl-ADP-ribose deacetylase [candidate division Zixibacteria bacterium]